MDATYISTNSFSVPTDRTLEFVIGRRVKCDCGVDGIIYADVVSATYTSVTTVVIDENSLTSNLVTVLYGVVEPGPNGSLPNHNHTSTEGMGGEVSLLYLSDTPTTYSGAGTLLVTTESGVEFTYEGRWFVDSGDPYPIYPVSFGGDGSLYLDKDTGNIWKQTPYVPPNPFSGDTVTVGPSGRDYTTIAAGIAGANDGDIISIDAGDYPVQLNVNKHVHLRCATPGSFVNIYTSSYAGYISIGPATTFCNNIKTMYLENINIYSTNDNRSGLSLEFVTTDLTLLLNKCKFGNNTSRQPIKNWDATTEGAELRVINCYIDSHPSYGHFSTMADPFSIEKTELDSGYTCDGCTATPDPADYVTTPTAEYGVDYGTYYLDGSTPNIQWQQIGNIHEAPTLLDLTDTPSTYSGTEGAMLVSTGSGTEFTHNGRWYIDSGIPSDLVGSHDNLYIDKDTNEVYRYVFTSAVSGTQSPVNETVLLLHMEGTDGGTTFTDDGTGTNCPHTMSYVGSVTTEEDAFKFGNTSAYYPSISTHRIYTGSSSDFSFGTAAFTIDFFVKFATGAGSQYLFDIGANGTYMRMTNNVLTFDQGGVILTYSWTPDTNWHHIAVESDGSNNQYLYVDGSVVYSANYTGSFGSAAALSVGNWGGGTAFSVTGYIDEFRVVKGLQTGNGTTFPVPSNPYNFEYVPAVQGWFKTGTTASGVSRDNLIDLDDTPSTYYDSIDSYLVTTDSGVEFIHNGRWFVDYEAPAESYGRLNQLYLDAFYKDVYQKKITTYSGTIATNQSNTFSIANYTTYYDYLAIDGDPATYWCSAGDNISWWGYEFTDRPRVITKIKIQAPPTGSFGPQRCPVGFKLMAGNSEPSSLSEAESGTELFEYKASGVPDYPDHHTGSDLGVWSSGEIKEWEFDNEALYTHYWILMWDKSEDYFSRGADYIIAEIELFELVSIRWNRIGSVDAPHWFFGVGTPTEDVPIGAIGDDLYFNENTGDVYEKSDMEGHPVLYDDFYGAVLDVTKWSTNIVDNASITVDDQLDVNNITGNIHSGAHFYTVNSFPKEGNYILNMKWLPSIDDHYDAGCGPSIKFCKPDASRDSYYGARQEQFFGVLLCQAGAWTTERTAFRLCDAGTSTNLVNGYIRSTETISIDESIWHDLEITIDCDTRRFTIDLDYGAYNFYFDVNQSSWDSLGDNFVIEIGSTDYNKTNTESFDDIVLKTTTSGYWSLTSNLWGSGSSASNLLELTDTPTSYDNGRYLRSTVTGTEWADVSANLVDLTDTPGSYDTGKYLRSIVSGTEWADVSTNLVDLNDTPETYDYGKSLVSTASGTVWATPAVTTITGAVLYGTSEPPSAAGYVDGTLFFKYVD